MHPAEIYSCILIVRIVAQSFLKVVFCLRIFFLCRKQYSQIVIGLVIIGVDFQQILEGPFCFLIPFQFLESNAQVIDAARPSGFTFEASLIFTNSIVIVSAAFEGNSEVVPQYGVVFVVFQSALKQFDSLLGPPLMMIQIPQIVICHEKARIMADCLFIELFGLSGFVHLLETVGIVIGNIGPLRCQFVGFPEHFEGFINVILFTIYNTEIVIGFNIVFVQLDSLEV